MHNNLFLRNNLFLQPNLQEAGFIRVVLSEEFVDLELLEVPLPAGILAPLADTVALPAPCTLECIHWEHGLVNMHEP